uniref:Adenylyl cyclase-associated protein n=1 Tax=Cebus imitator TaxID=2715852 RepID=A0A2K5Q5X6_CEBIM
MADMQNLVERLERAVGHLEAVSHTSDMHCGYGDSPSKAGAAPYMQAFDSLLASPVTEYLKISKEIGGDMQKHAEMVHTGLKLERALLVTASHCQHPADSKLSDLLAPISEQIKEVITFREKNRGSKLFNHLSAVSESIQALGWVAVAPKPGPYVKSLSIWTGLQAYIKEFHTTRLAWNKTGPVAEELSGLPSGPSAGSDPPSPPPGPPPPPVSTSSGSDESASRSALFAQINRGEHHTYGCHAYLSKNSLDCETVTAKSSEKNVLIPTEGSDPMEWQKLVTTVTEIAG